MAAWRVHDALGAAMDLARTANGYVEERQPWTQAKNEGAAADLDETLTTLLRALTVLSALFFPVTPEKMYDLAMALGLDGVPTIDESRSLPLVGRKVAKSTPLFPKVEPSWGVPG
jgi:methionyl-tRNA synthetase